MTTEEKTELATVIEPSKELEIVYQPLIITSNIEGLSRFMDELIEPFVSGELDISTPELEKEARAILADLNSIIKEIDQRRITDIKKISQPIKDFEDEIKAILQKGKDEYRKCKEALDLKVAEAERERHENLAIEYLGIVGEKVAGLIPFDRIANPKWKTKSFGEIKAQNELFEKAEQILSDMKTLDEMTLAYRSEVITCYTQTVDLRAAINRDRELIEQKEESDRKAKEAAEAFNLKQEAPAPAEAPKVEQAQDLERDDYTLILRDVTIFDAKEVALRARDITGKRPELKKGVING